MRTNPQTSDEQVARRAKEIAVSKAARGEYESIASTKVPSSRPRKLCLVSSVSERIKLGTITEQRAR